MQQELIEKLQSIQNLNLTEEQAKEVLNTITGFIKEKFPMMTGAVDSLFGG